MTPQVGQPAPSFSLPDHTGKIHSLADYTGQWLLIYFYPKDDTPGCTTEACSLRDNLPKFKDMTAAIVGISADSVASHAKFAAKYGLPFTILADEDKSVCEAYGTRGVLGIKRNSFLVNPKGVIVKVYEGVKPAAHAAEVLADITALQ